jgi:hypothetical protein
MIRYDLICDKGHAFDGWFADSKAYDAQAADGLISCSNCGSEKIEKQLMAPGIPTRGNRKPEAAQQMMASPSDPRQQMLLKMMRELRSNVEANAEYVGDRFPEEARRIHYAETEKRGIFGEASKDEAAALVEEGIEIHPLPRLPEDGN